MCYLSPNFSLPHGLTLSLIPRAANAHSRFLLTLEFTYSQMNLDIDWAAVYHT